MSTQRARPPILAWSLIPAALLFAACSNSSGGGGGGNKKVVVEVEPNDTSAEALALGDDVPGVGDVATAGDVDFWSAALQAGWVIQVEVLATRATQAEWDANDNIPRLTLYDTDGTTRLMEHDNGGNTTTTGSWDWEKHDLDFPMFRVPADGTYYIAVTQDDDTVDGGGYGVRWTRMNVGTLQLEAEAKGVTGDNDDFTTAEPISPGMVYGFHADDDEDYFSFTIPASNDGYLVRFDLTIYRNGVFEGDDESTDPELSLYDTDGVTVLFNNDDARFYDSGIDYVLVDPGTYFVNVLEHSGAGDGAYFLKFDRISLAGIFEETEPNDTSATANAISYGRRATGEIDAADTDFYSFAGTAGDMVRLQMFDEFNVQGLVESSDFDLIAPDGTTVLGTGGDDDLATLTTILQETGTFFVRVTSPGAVGLDGYGFELTRFRAAGYEVEPNDDDATANPLDGGERAAGMIEAAADVDVFSFTATANRVTGIAIYAGYSGSDGDFNFSGHGSSMEPQLTIRDSMGVVVAQARPDPLTVFAQSVTNPLPSIQLAFLPETSGTYYVEVADEVANFGSDVYYVIEQF